VIIMGVVLGAAVVMLVLVLVSRHYGSYLTATPGKVNLATNRLVGTVGLGYEPNGIAWLKG